MATAAAAPQSVPLPKRRKAGRVWWHVHQWVGLKLAIFMSFICLTGTLAVVSHEIDWLLQPTLRVAPSSVVGEPDWARIHAGARDWRREAQVQYMSAPVAGAFAATAVVEYPDETLKILHIHPTTGRVQGEGTWVGAQRVLRNMHRHLNLPVKYGVPLVGLLAILLLISLVTSFWVYKKWWRGFFKPIRWRDARTAWGDVHRLMGLWSLWFVLLMALTGVWYLVEELGLEAPPGREAPPAQAGTSSAGRGATDVAAGLAAARAALPGLRIEHVSLPLAPGDALTFSGQLDAVLVRERANAVAVDSAGTTVLLVRRGEELNVHQRISEMADPLHFGTFGGYWTKVPWFLFGLMLTGLSVSGIAIYGLRVGKAMPSVGALRTAWRGMGRWRWAALVPIAIAFALLPELLAKG
jgi:uncharacterized iron-regulated membrane protein